MQAKWKWHRFYQSENMEEKNYTDEVPDSQENGKNINAESVAELGNTEAATALFEKAKARLFDVNHWQDFAGKALAHFQITDSSGNNTDGPVREGCFFKIDVPGPATEDGEGFDWVHVESVSAYESVDVESVAIRVRPASNPASAHRETAHFYSSDSTSTFTVTREKTKVTAAVYDRNIKANTETEGVIDQVRNFLVGVAGKITGSKIQWKSLTDGLIDQSSH